MIRYDLLLGPHKYYNGHDTDPELLASLDAETARDFYAAVPQPIYLDVLMEDIAGRELSAEEREGKVRQLVERIRERAMKSKKQQAISAR